jgi:hypothetical protein
MRTAVLLLLFWWTGCAAALRQTAPSETESTTHVASLMRDYRAAHLRAGWPSRVMLAGASSPRLHRLARQVARMSLLVGRAAGLSQAERDAVASCGELAWSIAGSGSPLAEHLALAGTTCATALAAVGDGPGAARPFVVQAEQLARALLEQIDLGAPTQEAAR